MGKVLICFAAGGSTVWDPSFCDTLICPFFPSLPLMSEQIRGFSGAK